MINRITSVKVLKRYEILAVFQNGVSKKFDMKQLFDMYPQFRDFESKEGLFESVQVDAGGYGVSWNDFLDLDAEDIWENGIEVGRKPDIDALDQLAINLTKARASVGMTQKQLAEATGIYQADISRIERGLANPSLATLKRLAAGMGMSLNVEFVKNPDSNKGCR